MHNKEYDNSISLKLSFKGVDEYNKSIWTESLNENVDTFTNETQIRGENGSLQ